MQNHKTVHILTGLSEIPEIIRKESHGKKRKVFFLSPPWQSALVISLLWPVIFLFFNEPRVTLHYLGHSCFYINFDDRVTVLADYGEPDAWREYGWSSPIYSIGDIRPDIVTYSHLHADHFDSSRIGNEGIVVYRGGETIECNGLRISTIETSEKDVYNKDNNSYLFEYKGIKILHMGDCQADIMNIGEQSVGESFLKSLPEKCDIILFPIESSVRFPDKAVEFVKYTNSRVYIPMHFWTLESRIEFLKIIDTTQFSEGLDPIVIKPEYPDYIYRRRKSQGKIQIVEMQRSGL